MEGMGVTPQLLRVCERLAAEGCPVHVTLDADAVDAAEVPGVSAPNADGLAGGEVLDAT